MHSELKRDIVTFIGCIVCCVSLGSSFIIPILSRKPQGFEEETGIQSNITEVPSVGDPPDEPFNNGGNIDGDTVWWENDYARLEVYPHTSTNICKQTQFANVTWKYPDNNIDIAFRFKDSLNEKNIWIWANISHDVSVPDYGYIYANYTLHNISDIQVINETVANEIGIDFGDIPSDFYRKGNASYWDDYVWWNNTYYIGFDNFHWLNAEHTSALFNYTYWGQTGSHIEEQFWFDWKNINNHFNHLEHNGKHYYYIKDWSVIQGKSYNFKWQYNTPLTNMQSRGKWELLAKLSSDTIQEAFDSGRYVMIDPWWNSDWSYYKQITIDHNYIDSTLTNFPILVNITDTDLRDDAQADGDDIAFVDSSNSTQYNHEIEKFDGSTGKLVAWVNITSLSSSSDTVINMYYGNASASSQENVAGTWNSDYVMVHHLNETPSDNGNFDDSTSNNNDGTWQDDSSNGDSDASGLFAGCVQFEDSASDNYIDLGSLTGFKSVSFWVNAPSRTDYDFIFAHNDVRVYFHTNLGEIMFGDSSSNLIQTDVDIDDFLNTWFHIVAISDTTSSRIYVNDVEYTDTDNFDAVSSETTNLGRWTGDSHYSDVFIEELQVFKSVLSDDMVDAIYNSQNSAYDSGFFTVGSEQSEAPPEWSNTNPVASSPNPPDTQIDVELSLTNYYDNFNITIVDLNEHNQSINVTWRTNESGNWLDMGWNESTTCNSTFYCTNVSWIDTPNTKYWWSRNVSDNHSTKGWDNNTYSFTTGIPPLSPTNLNASNPTLDSINLSWLNGKYGNNSLRPFTVNGSYRSLFLSTNNPNAVQYNNITYILHQDSNGDIDASYYNHSNYIWVRNIDVGDNPDTDEHGIPVFLPNATGHFHAFWGAHTTPFEYAISDNPYDVTAWTQQSDIPADGTSQSLVRLNNGSLILIYRGTVSSTDLPLLYRTEWESFGTEHELVNFTTDNALYPYDVVLNNNGTKIYFTWSFKDYTDDSQHKNIYFAYLNLSDWVCFNISGQNLGVAIDESEANTYCKIYDSNGLRSSPTTFDLDSDENPYMLFTYNESSINFTYYDGDSWVTPVAIVGCDQAGDTGDLIVHNSTSITAYIVENGTTADSRGGNIAEWSWDGVSWSRDKYILNESVSGKPVVTPRIVWNHTDAMKVVFGEWDDTTSNLIKGYLYGDGGFIGLSPIFTHVRYSKSDNLTSRTDGTFACNITGTIFNVTGLDSGTTYYFRAWSYSPNGGWNSTGSNTVSLATSATIKEWNINITGYLTGGNDTLLWTVDKTGYLIGGNDTLAWNIDIPGWLSGGNDTLSYSVDIPGWLSGGNESSYSTDITGYLIGGNDTLDWNVDILGWLSGGNDTLVWDASVTGYLTGGNESITTVWNLSKTGWLSGGNDTLTWALDIPGYLIGGNDTLAWTIDIPGWLSGGNDTLAWDISVTGYLTGGNETDWELSKTGYLLGGNDTLSWIVDIPGWLSGGNDTLSWTIDILGWLSGGNETSATVWNLSKTGYLLGGNDSVYATDIIGYLTGGNDTVSWNINILGWLSGGNETSATVWNLSKTGYLAGGNDTYLSCSFTYTVKGSVITVTPTITGATRYKWTIDGGGDTGWIPIADEGNHQFVLFEAGNYKITLTAENNTGASVSHIEKVTVAISVAEEPEPPEIVEEEEKYKMRNVFEGISDWFGQRSIGELVFIGIIGFCIFLMLLRKRPKKSVIYPVIKK